MAQTTVTDASADVAPEVPERRVVRSHAFRNALIPITTIIAFDVGAIIGGAVVIKDPAVAEAVTGGAWVMGPQVRQFETDLAAFGQARHALGCANGTDALALPLMAWGIGRGDAVFVPSFTFAATANSVALTGATPVFADIEPDHFCLSPDAVRARAA